MSWSRFGALSLLLGLFGGTACDWNPTGAEICLHSEGCGNGGGWGIGDLRPPLGFTGQVTSATTGQLLVGVTVRMEVPVRAWSEVTLTDSTGSYRAYGLPGPAARDCANLVISFSREGYQPLRLADFPQLNCAPGILHVNASLTPTQ